MLLPPTHLINLENEQDVMPSPIGHTLLGLTIEALLAEDGRGRRGTAAFWANAPDMDMAAGLIEGRPGAWHAHETHSVGAALAAGLAAGLLAWARGGAFRASFVSGTAAYASHVLLDFMGKRQEDGMPILWPFSRRRVASPRAWFSTITSRSRERGFFRGLLSLHNLSAVTWEVVTLAPLLILVLGWQKRKGPPGE